MSMSTPCALPSSVHTVLMMTMAILSAIVFMPVMATGDARWLRFSGLLRGGRV
jgi:hypothetical protein